jgi:four helix bundle protein
MDNKEYKQLLLKKSYAFTLGIMKLIEKLPRNVVSYDVISHQLMRSASSVGANIVEGQTGSSKRDFTNFLQYALKSANETNYWLGLLRDSGKVRGKMLDDLIMQCDELCRMLASSVIKLRDKHPVRVRYQ